MDDLVAWLKKTLLAILLAGCAPVSHYVTIARQPPGPSVPYANAARIEIFRTETTTEFNFHRMGPVSRSTHGVLDTFIVPAPTGQVIEGDMVVIVGLGDLRPKGSIWFHRDPMGGEYMIVSLTVPSKDPSGTATSAPYAHNGTYRVRMRPN